MGSITAAITMTITETGIIITTAYLEGEVVDEVEVGVINQLHYEAVVAVTAITVVTVILRTLASESRWLPNLLCPYKTATRTISTPMLQ